MRIVFVLGLLLLSTWAFSQTGYKLEFKVKGWKDSAVYLGHYYGENTYIKDTAKVSSDGAFIFQKKENLPQGVYFLVRKSSKGNNKVFDFVIGQDQTFALETAAPEYIVNMKVKGDDDNRLFFENILFNVERNKEAEPFVKIVKDSTLKEDQKKDARAGFAKINDKVMAHQKEVIEKYPTTLTARMFKAAMPVNIPDPPKKANGQIDSTFQLRYYREHFFDNFDLADEAMIRMPQPIYQQKLKEYTEKLFVPQPDSVTKAIHFAVAKAKKNQETYKYCVYNFVFLYQQPEIMGLDEVFVNVYDAYFKSGEMDYWANAKMKENMKEYADKIRSSMIGRTGANLIMQDQNLQAKSMYDIKNKYTLLFIFDPDCGHCRQETPKLVEFYNKGKAKFNVEVFAVSLDTSMQKMRDFIKEFKTTWITVNGPRSYVKVHVQKLYHADTTPTIYILDDKKKIIAKKLPVEKVEDFLTRYERQTQAKKTSGSNSQKTASNQGK
ncbi:MAG TPA: thioredoxin-like domain-containing protein [Cyclobacteriaceae bacterium]|nr:thioredoxin-like domain-containing protein [Cyclobacteriaceae bacterium]